MMTDVITGNTKRIYLSHLSQDNNMKDLARMSVGQVLNEHDIDTEKKYCYVIRIKLFQRQYIQYSRESPDKVPHCCETTLSGAFYIVGGKWLLLS